MWKNHSRHKSQSRVNEKSRYSKGVFLIQSADPHNVFWILTFYLRSTGGTISHMFVLILIFNTVGERTGSTLDHNIASSKHYMAQKFKKHWVGRPTNLEKSLYYILLILHNSNSVPAGMVWQLLIWFFLGSCGSWVSPWLFQSNPNLEDVYQDEKCS